MLGTNGGDDLGNGKVLANDTGGQDKRAVLEVWVGGEERVGFLDHRPCILQPLLPGHSVGAATVDDDSPRPATIFVEDLLRNDDWRSFEGVSGETGCC